MLAQWKRGITLSHSLSLPLSLAVMADRKGKAVAPIKKLTKKEKEELKKNVSAFCSFIPLDEGIVFFAFYADASYPASCTGVLNF